MMLLQMVRLPTLMHVVSAADEALTSMKSAASYQGECHPQCCQHKVLLDNLWDVVIGAQNQYFTLEAEKRRWTGSCCMPSMSYSAGKSNDHQSKWKDLLSALLGGLAKYWTAYKQGQQQPDTKLPHAEVSGQSAGSPHDQSQASDKIKQLEVQVQQLTEEYNYWKQNCSETDVIANQTETLAQQEIETVRATLEQVRGEKEGVQEQLIMLTQLKSQADENIKQLEVQVHQLTEECKHWKQNFCEVEERAKQTGKVAQLEIETTKAYLEQVQAEKEGVRQELMKMQRQEIERGKKVLLSGSYLDNEANPTLVQTMAKQIKDTLSSFAKAYMQPLGSKDSSSGPVDRIADFLQQGVARFSRSSHVKHTFEAAILHICFQNFESSTFNGFRGEPCLDREKARTASFEEFKQIQATDGLPQLHTTHSQFCVHNFAQIWSQEKDMAVFGNTHLTDMVAQGEQPSSDVYSCFARFATSVWLMHLLCASFEPAATLFKVEVGSAFDPAYMKSVAICEELEEQRSQELRVAFMVVPGFRAGRSIIKSLVYLQ